MRRGISPLVAAVILIAATMSIAGILSYWATSFVRTRLISAENATEETTCLAAQFRLYSGTYDSINKELILILENQRSIDLELNGLYLFDENDVLTEEPLTGSLEGNRLKSFNITDVSNFTKGIVKTNCPDVSVEFTYNQVT